MILFENDKKYYCSIKNGNLVKTLIKAVSWKNIFF